MSFIRRLVALALMTAVVTTACVLANPPAFAQDPPNNQGAAKAKGGANQKKPARRKPRGNGAVGVIVPYPLPPVLIIRHTAETQDEVQAFLNMLRYY